MANKKKNNALEQVSRGSYSANHTGPVQKSETQAKPIAKSESKIGKVAGAVKGLAGTNATGSNSVPLRTSGKAAKNMGETKAVGTNMQYNGKKQNSYTGISSLASADTKSYTYDPNKTREIKQFTPYQYKATTSPKMKGMSYDSSFTDENATVNENEFADLYDRLDSGSKDISAQEYIQLAALSTQNKAGINFFGMGSTNDPSSKMTTGGNGVVNAAWDQVTGNAGNDIMEYNQNQDAKIDRYVQAFADSNPTEEEFNNAYAYITSEIENANAYGDSYYAKYMGDLRDKLVKAGAQKKLVPAYDLWIEKEQGKLDEETAKAEGIVDKWTGTGEDGGRSRKQLDSKYDLLKAVNERIESGEASDEEMMALYDQQAKLEAEINAGEAAFTAEAENPYGEARRANDTITRLGTEREQAIKYNEMMADVNDPETIQKAQEFYATVPAYDPNGSGSYDDSGVYTNGATLDQIVANPVQVMRSEEDAQHIDGSRMRDDVSFETSTVDAECAYYMTDEQRTKYFALRADDEANGTNTAEEYFELLKERTLLDQRKAGMEQVVQNAYEESSGVKRFFGNIASVHTNFLGQLMSALAGTGSGYNTNDPMNDLSTFTSAYRGATREDLNEIDQEWFNNPNVPDWQKGIVRFLTNGQGMLTGLYDDALNIGDNLYRGMWTGGLQNLGFTEIAFDIINNSLMGVTSFGSALYNNYEKYKDYEMMTEEELISRSVGEAINEISQETLLESVEFNKNPPKSWADVPGFIAHNMADEAMEEGFGSYFDIGVDVVNSAYYGNQTEIDNAIQEYMEKGHYTYSEALVMTFIEYFACNPVAAAGSGAITGGFSAGMNGATEAFRESALNREAGSKIAQNGPAAIRDTMEGARNTGDEDLASRADAYGQSLKDAGIDVGIYDEETMRMAQEQQNQEAAAEEVTEEAEPVAETETVEETTEEAPVEETAEPVQEEQKQETVAEGETEAAAEEETAEEETQEETEEPEQTPEQKAVDETSKAYEQGMEELNNLEAQLEEAEAAETPEITMDQDGNYDSAAIAAASEKGQQVQSLKAAIQDQIAKNDVLKQNMVLARDANIQAMRAAGKMGAALTQKTESTKANTTATENTTESNKTDSEVENAQNSTYTQEARQKAVDDLANVQKKLDEFFKSKKNLTKLGYLYRNALEQLGAKIYSDNGDEARRKIVKALGYENAKSDVVVDALTKNALGIATEDDMQVLYSDAIRDIMAGNGNMLTMVLTDMIGLHNSAGVSGTFTRQGAGSGYSQEAQQRMKMYEQLYSAASDRYNAVISRSNGNEAGKGQITVHSESGDVVATPTGKFKKGDNGLMAEVKNPANGDVFYTNIINEACANDAQAGTLNTIRTLAGNDVQLAVTLWGGYTASGYSDTFGDSIGRAYQYGRAGMTLEQTIRAIAPNANTEAAIRTAYEVGVKSSKGRNARAKNASNDRQRGGKFTAKVDGKTYDLTNSKDIDRFASDFDLNDNQKSAVRVFSKFAATRAVNIELFRSKADESGVITEENGTYNKDTNTIRIDINAGMDVSGQEFLKRAMGRVFSHELTHYIQSNNDAGYRQLTAAVMQALSNNGYNFTGLVNRQMQFIDAKNKSDQDIYDEAVDEVVANACEMMLRDSTVAEDIANEASKESRTLGQKILDFIKSFLSDLKKAFEGVSSNSYEARMLQSNEKAFKDVQKIWDNALKTAMQNAMSQEIDQTKAQEDGVSVSAEIANIMDSDQYEGPNERESIRSTVEWRRSHLQNYPADMSFKQISDLMDQLDQKVLMSDTLRMAVPHGIVNDVRVAGDAQSVKGAKREGSDEKFGKSNIGPLRSNEEYGFTFDLDTKCERTYNYLYLRDQIQNILGRQLNSFEARQLIELMRADGRYMIPCTYCYVEGKRMMLVDGYVKTITKESKKSIGRKVSPTDLFNAVEATRTIVSGYMDDRFNKEENYTVDKKTAVYKEGKEVFGGYRDFWMPSDVKVGDIVRDICEQYGVPYIEKQPKEVTDAMTKEEKAAYKFKFGAQRVIEQDINEWIYNHKLDVPMNLADTTTDWRTGTIDYDLLNMHSRGVIAAQGGVKANVVKNYKPYTDELSRVTDKEREHMNAMGGARIHSSNDFQVGNMQDYLLFFSDLAAGRSNGKGWYVHTYSKNLTFADIFSRFNARINCSVAFYTDRNGKVVPNEDEGCNHEQLQKLRKRNKNIGAMAMAVDNAQLAYALNSDWVDMIIPFHASGMPAEMFYDVMGWQNYTAIQGEKEYSADAMKERIKAKLGEGTKVTGNKAAVEEMFWNTFNKISGENIPTTAAAVDALLGTDNIVRLTKKNSKGKNVEYCPHFFPYDSVDSNGNFVPGHHNDAQRYKDLCDLYGGIPRFKGLQVYDEATGKTVDVTDHTNYVKLIKEAARTDTEQEYISMDDITKPSDEEGKSAWDKINEAMETFNGYGDFNQDPGDLQHRFVRDYVGENGEPIIGTAKDVMNGKAKFTVGDFVDTDRELSDRNKAISDGYYEQRQERMNDLIETVYEAEQTADKKERKKIMDTHNVAANPIKSQSIRFSGRNYPSSGIQFLDPSQYTQEKIATIMQYLDSVDDGLVDFYNDVLAMPVHNAYKAPYVVGQVSESVAGRVRDISGLDLEGKNIIMSKGAVKHIENRHGKAGEQDQSMADTNDVARMLFVLNNADDAYLVDDFEGQTDRSAEYRNSDHTPAVQIKFEKAINGTVYVVVAAPDVQKDNKKKLGIVSVYAETKKKTYGMVASDFVSAANPTPVASSSSSSSNIITDDDANGNSSTADTENNSPYETGDVRSSKRTGEVTDRDLIKMANEAVAQTETEREYLKMYKEATGKLVQLNNDIQGHREAMNRFRNAGDHTEATKEQNRINILRKQLDGAMDKVSALEESKPLMGVMWRIRRETEEAVLEALTQVRDAAGTGTTGESIASDADIEKALKAQAHKYQLEIVKLKDQIKQEQKRTAEAKNGPDARTRRGKAPDTKKLIDSYERRIKQLETRIATMDNGTARQLAKEVQKRDNAIRDMRDRRKATETRQKIRRIIDNFNQRLAHPRENRYIPADMVRGIIQALESFDLSYVRNGEEVVSKSIRDMHEVYERYKKDGEYTYYNSVIAGRLEQLAQDMGETKFRNMKADQLQKVYEHMQSLHDVITNAVKFKTLTGYKDAYEAGDKAIAQVQAAKPMVKGFAGEMLNWMASPDNFFKRITGFAKDSVLTQMQQKIVEGEQRMLEVQREYVNTFAEYTKSEAFKKLGDHKMKELVDVGLKSMDLNEDGEHEPVMITRGMMLSLYMHLCSDDNLRGIARGGLKVPNLTRYYEKNPAAAFDDESAMRTVGIMQRTDGLYEEYIENGLDEKMARIETAKDRQALEDNEVSKLMKLRDSIWEMMSEDERGMTQAAHDWFDKKSKKYLNEISMDLYGFKVASVENYFPIHRDSNFLNTQFESISNDASLANMGFLKERVKASQPILLMDFAYEMASSVDRTSRYIGFAKAERDFNLLYKAQLPGMTTSLREQIGKKFKSGDKKIGVTGMQYIENYMNSIVGNNRSKATIWDDIRSNLARSTLTLNPRVALSQAASIPTAIAELDMPSIAKAMKDIGVAFNGKYKEQLAQDDVWFFQRYRGEGGMTEFADARKNGTKLDRIYNTIADTKVGKKLMNWCQDFDVGSTAIIHKATEYWVTSHTGYTQGSEEWKQAVADKYRDVLRRTQPMYTTTARSDLMRSSDGIMKTFTMFKTQASQNLNTLYNASAEFKKFKQDYEAGINGVTAEDVKEARERFSHSITGVVMGAAAYAVLRFLVNALMGKTKKYKDDDTDDMTVMSTVKGIGLEALESMASMVAFGSEAWSIGESIISGGRYYGISETAVGQIGTLAEDMVDLAKNVTTGKLGEKSVKFGKDLSTVLGIPYSNAENAVNMITYYINGMTSGVFESTATKTDNAIYNRAISAMLEGNDENYEKMIAEEMRMSGKTLKEAQAGLKNRITYWYENGSLTRDETEKLLTGDKLALDADKVYWILDRADYAKSHGGKTDGYDMYQNMEDAIMEGTDTAIQESIKFYKNHGEKDTTVVKNAAKTLYQKDSISWEQAQNILVQYGGFTKKDKRGNVSVDEDNLFWTQQEWDYKKSGEATLSEGSFDKYMNLDKAVDKDDIGTAVEQVNYLMQHGVTKKSLTSHLANQFKDYYLELLDVDPAAAEQYLSSVILPIYKAAGYDEAYERKYIKKNWK